MAAIQGTITGANSSATFMATNGISDVMTTARGGACYLQARPPGGEWTILSGIVGAYDVITSDSSIEYRFLGVDGTDTDYYMGP